MNGLLANFLGGAVGGGLSSYADQLKKEAAQARQERLKKEERGYRKSVIDDERAHQAKVRKKQNDRQDAQIAERNERQDARWAVEDERYNNQQKMALNSAKEKAQSNAQKMQFDKLKFRADNINQELDRLEKQRMSFLKNINASVDEFGNLSGGSGSMTDEQRTMYNEVINQRDSLAQELNQINSVLFSKETPQQKVTEFDDGKLSEMIQKVTPGTEHEFLSALKNKGLDEATQYRAKTLLQQRGKDSRASENNGLLHQATQRTEANRRQFANNQYKSQEFGQLQNYLDAFMAKPRQLSPQEKTQIQSLIQSVTPQTTEQQNLVNALANIIRY